MVGTARKLLKLVVPAGRYVGGGSGRVSEAC